MQSNDPQDMFCREAKAVGSLQMLNTTEFCNINVLFGKHRHDQGIFGKYINITVGENINLFSS